MKASIVALMGISLVCGCVSSTTSGVERGVPYQLSDRETYTVRDYVSGEFYLPRAVRMHPMNASQRSDGTITVCGVADAIGQEGPGEAIGYRPYAGILVPERDAFAVTKLANNSLDDLAIQRYCESVGAPILFSEDVKRFKSLVYGG